MSHQPTVGGRAFMVEIRLNAYSIRPWWGYRRLNDVLGGGCWRAQLYFGHRLFEVTYTPPLGDPQ